MTATTIAHQRQDFRSPEHRNGSGQFAVSSVPKHLGYGDDPYGDELILVDGWQIGGTYHCADDTWASYGPAAYSSGHLTRQAAIDAQVRAYVIDPGGYERICDDQLAEETAEQTARDAKAQAERDRRAGERRRARLGDDEPGPTIRTVPAYHALYAPDDETHRVYAWLKAHGIENASALHEIRVEQRAARQVIVYEAAVLSMYPTRDTPTETHVVTLKVAPPTVDTPGRPDLHALIEEHWPTKFPLIDYGRSMACPVCTRATGSMAEVVKWPCGPLTEAISKPLVEATA